MKVEVAIRRPHTLPGPGQMWLLLLLLLQVLQVQQIMLQHIGHHAT